MRLCQTGRLESAIRLIIAQTVPVRSKNVRSEFSPTHGIRCLPPWTGSAGEAPCLSRVRTRQATAFRSRRVDLPRPGT